MQPPTFIDTSGFYAITVRNDEAHLNAVRWLEQAKADRLHIVTTDYVLDETATLLISRGHRHLLHEFFDRVFSSKACTIEWIGPERFDKARDFCFQHNDKDYSFTDCASFVVMRELGLKAALTKDEHFKHIGFKPLLAS